MLKFHVKIIFTFILFGRQVMCGSPFKNYVKSGNQLRSSCGPLSFTFRADFSKIVSLIYIYSENRSHYGKYIPL